MRSEEIRLKCYDPAMINIYSSLQNLQQNIRHLAKLHKSNKYAVDHTEISI